jgi:surface antigen
MHALMLLTILGVPGIAGMMGQRNAAPAGTANFIQAFAAGRDAVPPASIAGRGFILKPTVAGAAPVPERRQPETYAVKSGDVLGGIAARFGLRIDTIRDSNSLVNVDKLKIGQRLLIPPTNGIMVRAGGGDTVRTLADKYHADPQVIIDYNLIREPDHLASDALVMIPDGTGLIKPQESTVDGTASPPSSPLVPREIPFGHSSYNRFPWGQCTYWVASKRDIPWNGNAWTWFGSAQAAGWATGKSPRVGAIMVTWESRYYGHVSLVEAVYDDGSWLISEMNYRGLGVVDHRRITYGSVPLIGFIY